MPDDELFARAKDGSLLDEETLRSEVERMLDDPRAQALTDHFAGQWLSLRDLPNVFKDPGTFPEFSDSLRAAMQEERRLFFDSFIRDDRPIQELLTADEAWINSELADFYGVQGADGSNFSKVSVADTSRRGLLGQAGLMAVLGHPESTAPVLRGKWVLDRLLCRTPPPPPGDIEIPSVPNGGMMTMREKLAVHRENPVCAGCHNEMDPIGLSLENFDGIGQFRAQEAGQTIDVSGNLPDGTVHAGPVELAQHIAQSPDFIACSVEKALVYALAPDLGLNDRGARAQIQENFLAEGAGMRSLLREIAVSPLFRTRQGVSQ